MRPIISTVHTANDSTAMPNSTAKTLLGSATVILPSWAKSILAVSAKSCVANVTTATPYDGQIDVESNDLSVMPFQVFPAPIAGIINTTATTLATKPEIYKMNAACNGGEQISIYGTALNAPGATDALYLGANLLVSNIRPEVMGQLAKQRRAKVGTYTATGTTANADVAGTRYNFSGGSHIVELMGILNNVTVIADKGFAGHIKYTSNEFDGVSEVKMDLNPVSGGFGTTGNAMADGASRLVVDIPVLPGQGQVNIQDYAYFGAISSTAGKFCSGVIYE